MRAINRNYYLVLLGLSDKYQWVEDPKPFDVAREYCQSLGDGWDMAIIMNRVQLGLFTDLGDQWMGFQRNGQETETIFGKVSFWAGIKYDKKETFAEDCISLNSESRRIVTKNCQTSQVGFQWMTKNQSLTDHYTYCGNQMETPNKPFMCEKHPLSNTCFPGDNSGSSVADENSRYKVFRSQEKTKLEAEEACKNIDVGWSLAFLKSKEWNHL